MDSWHGKHNVLHPLLLLPWALGRGESIANICSRLIIYFTKRQHQITTKHNTWYWNKNVMNV